MPKIILNPGRPIQQQLSKEGTKYVIKNPIDLHGENIKIPLGSTLEFSNQGLLKNGTLTGNETTLKHPILHKIFFKGTFANNAITVNDAFDAETDFWNLVKCFPKADITLAKDIMLPDAPVKDITIDRFHINGKGHTITVGTCPILRNVDVCISNIVFDCKKAKEHIIYALGITPKHRFTASNCKFYNTPEATSLCPRAYTDVLIKDCTITGMLNKNSRRSKQFTAQILIYECTGNVIVKNNIIKNCFGAGIDGIGFKPNKNSHVLIKCNTIDNVTNGGIVFAGGDVWNVTVQNNIISNTHVLGNNFDDENNGGPNSAINFHGFHNIVVKNNTITDCLNSLAMTFNGSASGNTMVKKGSNLRVHNNRCTRTGHIALFVVEDVSFKGNAFINDDTNASQSIVSVSGASNIEIKSNQFRLAKGIIKSYYPVYITDAGIVPSGRIKIEDNRISTNDKYFIFVNTHFTGNCEVGKNAIEVSGLPDGKLFIVNNSTKNVDIPLKGKLVRYYR